MFTRVEVEGGFLNGLDLTLSPGLNVLIGPRGAGKTSVIELVRFCLGAPAYTSAVQRRAEDHARSVLAGGRVTVTGNDPDGQSYTVSRAADDDFPLRSDFGRLRRCVVLAQNEIERVGLDRLGRLRLLDGFVQDREDLRAAEERVLSSVSSLTKQVSGVVAEIKALRDRRTEIVEETAGLVLDEPSEPATADGELQKQQLELARLDDQLASQKEQLRVLTRVDRDIESWLQAVSAFGPLLADIGVWPDADSLGLDLSDVMERLRVGGRAIDQARDALEQARLRALEKRSVTQSGIVAGEEASRLLRARLEALQEGAGRRAQQAARMQQLAREGQAVNAFLESKVEHAAALQNTRKEALDQLDELRRERFSARKRAADELNARLKPHVHVEITRMGLYEEYAGAIVAALRGSGLRYTELAPLLAEQLAPRELCEAVELGDSAKIATAAGITRERAGRIVDALRDSGIEEIIVAPVEDAVELFLLDGPDYKRTDELSTGQRCTVVLPILLCHQDLTILIDQPEDHLDNGFVVDTVVSTLRERGANAQFVLATHNANIPVLGEADAVGLLASDGRHGFLSAAGPLEAAPIKAAISTVMEGGAQAFERRAEFYAAAAK